MDAIVPAAGLATRMRGIPKFLLPCDLSYTTLIERHISHLLPLCDVVWIPTRPELVGLLNSLGLSRDRIVILPMQTDTMTETIMRVLRIASSEVFQLIMPDTYFLGDTPYARLSNAPAVADLSCWGIRDAQRGKLGQVLLDDGGVVTDMRDKDPSCDYSLSWGALTFSRAIEPFLIASDPHVGYAVRAAVLSGAPVTGHRIEGRYFDCGTPAEYIQMLGTLPSE